MVGQLKQSFVSALSLAQLSHSLPGLRTLAPRQCSDKDPFNGAPCSNTGVISADSIGVAATTDNPSYTASSTARIDIFTAICEDNACSIFDVSASLVTVINGNSLVSPTATSALAPGVGYGSGTPAAASRGPYAKGTNSSTFAVGPTGTGQVSGTGISSANSNSTSLIHSTVTLSVTTVPDLQWGKWSSASAGKGTGVSFGSSVTFTESRPYANATTPQPSPTYANSTYVSAGQTFTTQVPMESQSFASTATFSLPQLNVSSTEAAAATVTSAPGVDNNSSSSYSSCWTTYDYSTFSSNGTISLALGPLTKVCWDLECHDSNCTDHITRYPLYSSSSATTTAEGNDVSSSSASPPITYGGDTSTAAATSTSEGPFSPWLPSNGTRNPDAYTITNSPATAGSSGTSSTVSLGLNTSASVFTDPDSTIHISTVTASLINTFSSGEIGVPWGEWPPLPTTGGPTSTSDAEARSSSDSADSVTSIPAIASYGSGSQRKRAEFKQMKQKRHGAVHLDLEKRAAEIEMINAKMDTEDKGGCKGIARLWC